MSVYERLSADVNTYARLIADAHLMADEELVPFGGADGYIDHLVANYADLRAAQRKHQKRRTTLAGRMVRAHRVALTTGGSTSRDARLGLVSPGVPPEKG